MKPTYVEIAQEIGELVTEKQRQYGDAFSRAGKILEILYPDGISPHQMDDALAITRILDKFFRIAQRTEDGPKDLGGENPWRDICGYALLGVRKDLDP